ncbi:MAG: ATP-dependent DNA helicase RecG [Bdellovibrionaceae bacterium]|nr:ATP-dependent DNA helicase RecG [Pseudobdellovibrionaceae bacterium]
MALRIDTPIQFLKGVGPKLASVLRGKGVQTVNDLLQWYPRAYEDRRAARSISSLRPDELVALKAQVVSVSSFNMGKSRRKMYDVTVRDGTGKVHCKFFRVPYKGYFERFQPNQLVRVIGKVTYYRGQIEFHHPDIQDFEEEVSTGEERDTLLPIYPETEGLTGRQIQKLVRLALQELKLAGYDDPEAAFRPKTAMSSGRRDMRPKFVPFESPSRKAKALANGAKAVGTASDAAKVAAIPAVVSPNWDGEPEPLEKLPKWLREKYALPDRFTSLAFVHQPPKDAGIEWVESRSPFHRRLIFEEFFWLELYLAARHSGLQKEAAPALRSERGLVDRLVASLPFRLTGAQSRAFEEVVADLAKPHPMHRLVQGDVGSGKTLVALMSALIAVANRRQTAIMVPTEILAEQHYRNAVKYLEPLGVTIGFLTGSMKQSERQQTYDLLRSGAIDVIVGTHALIEDVVEFHDLGLVIIDEQHRFGVHQRSRLKQKGMSPHFLVMTATPIPRTLAMTVYGDLDVSVIDEMPPGRTEISTRVGYESVRPKMMQFLKDQLAKGRQAYVVYPLVEESEKIDLKDAVSAFESLRQELPQWKVGLLHGKMKPDEKDAAMDAFRRNEIQVLVSTTVIEVGVDVPNATLMIVEHTERFGLSQLHQLRGRVGRGQHKSFCILMLGHAVSDEGRTRARIMENTTDGFKIAEADLEMRGPGEFLGSRQSGLPGFRLANLVRDVQVLQEARAAAFEAIAKDATLTRSENKPLREELLRAHGATALASVG